MGTTTTRTLRPPLPLSIWFLRISFAVLTLVATLVTALAIFQMAYGDRVLPGVRVDGAATARAAHRLGRGGSPLRALSSQLDMMTRGAEVAPVVSVDPNAA